MLSIFSLNTWKCDGNYLSRINNLSILLKEIQPDIITFQESFESLDGKYSTNSFISKELSYNYATTLSRFKVRELDGVKMQSYSNVSILSRFPIQSKQIIKLPSSEMDGGRDCIAAEFNINNKSLLVASLHLSHLRNQPQLKYEQLEHLLGHSYIKKLNAPLIMCGDFNNEIDTYPLNEVLNKYNINYDHINKYPGEIKNTLINSNKIIDHIFVYPKSNHESIQTINYKILDGGMLSDHNPVMMNFRLA